MIHLKGRRCGALTAAIEAGIAGNDNENTAMFMDLDILQSTIGALKRAPFPPSTLHTFAVKANPVGRVLELMRDAGLGAEVASLGELRQALGCGFPPDRVVFDSPVKTRSELRFALEAGVRLNLDNLQEVERVAELVAAEPQLLYGSTEGGGRQRLIGLRINPQVGEGSIRALSTGGRISKFGIPLLERRRELLAAFSTHPWINALHLHVGSQGVPLDLTMEGIARVAELAEEVEMATAAVSHGRGDGVRAGRRILALDIGGGLPVRYGDDDLGWLLGLEAAAAVENPAAAATTAEDSIFARYAAMLRQRLPTIFAAAPVIHSGEAASAAAAAAASPLQLVTEFGRCLVAKAVFAAGRVEYSKHCGGRRVVVSGLGGDLLLRAVYLPDTWPVRVELYGANGQPKRPPPSPQMGEAGPAAAAAAAEQDSAATAAPEKGIHPAAVATAAPAAVVSGHADGAAWLGPTDVVGPLCFQGDRLAEAVPLPPAQPGDWIVVPDVGAYCLSMYSRYNSRCSPPVWGFRGSAVAAARSGPVRGPDTALGSGPGAREERVGSGMELPAAWGNARGGGAGGGLRRCGEYEFVLLRRGETVEEVVAFWNLLEPLSPSPSGSRRL